MRMRDLAGLAAGAAAGDPARPLVTFYDDGTGEWVELSGNTFANWVSKTANLLIDGCGLGTGDTALVAVSPHWQTAAILAGCWSAGLEVVTDGDGDVAFADSAISSTAGDRFFLGLAAMGMPYRGDLPDGWLDYIAEVRPHGDHFRPVSPADPDDPALNGETRAAVLARATARAEEFGIPADGRVLIDVTRYPDPVDYLLAPWTRRASVVLCRNVDATTLRRRAETERAGLTLA
jgi:uncharacterized protein (TIGR03089 family)